MTPFELARLLEYVAKNNGWYDPQEVHDRNRMAIKYVDASFDSRDGKVWHIKFRSIVGHPDDVNFRVESEEDIAKVYAFLERPLYAS